MSSGFSLTAESLAYYSRYLDKLKNRYYKAYKRKDSSAVYNISLKIMYTECAISALKSRYEKEILEDEETLL